MGLSVGYPVVEQVEPFCNVVQDYRAAIDEVYFAWPGVPSGRSPYGMDSRGCISFLETKRDQLFRDLSAFRRWGLRLNLLVNANCYGGDAISKAFGRAVARQLAGLEKTIGAVEYVTTTSPFVAHIVRSVAPGTRVLASVNMRLGTIGAMQGISDELDGFYLQRDVQRNLETLHAMWRWADAQRKELRILANSGCLRYCAYQQFHDNCVAHETDMSCIENTEDWLPYLCWKRYRDPANWRELLQSTWIRPEDLESYLPYVHGVKLATRMQARPRLQIHAYATGRFLGNLLDLLEPSHSFAIAPHIVDNTRFPDDWLARTSSCHGQCHQCDYCQKTLDLVLKKVGPRASPCSQ